MGERMASVAEIVRSAVRFRAGLAFEASREKFPYEKLSVREPGESYSAVVNGE